MTWHLKDRELEKKLIAIDPKFLERINEGAVLKDNLRMDTCMMITNHVAVRFEAKDFEDVPEYDPDTWNEYPKVIPPQHEPLRVEFADKSGTKAFFDDCLREYVTAKRIDSPCRYRPWED